MADPIYLASASAREAKVDPTEGMTCPECLSRGVKGLARIGSRRGKCATCNRYGAAVRRAAMTILKAKHPRAYERAMRQARASVYQGTVEEYRRRGLPTESPTLLVRTPPPDTW